MAVYAITDPILLPELHKVLTSRLPSETIQRNGMNPAKEHTSMDSKTASGQQLGETKRRILFWLLSAIRWVPWIALANLSRPSKEIEHGHD
jgi:hypothetical protein